MSVAERFQGANVVDAGRLSPYWGEHAARYSFAVPYVEEKKVLDIACGTGYGIGILKRGASYVVGVDVSMDAALEACAECIGNASVLLGDGLELPFSDESFDVITSFETLEHLHERGGFLKELGRVLRADGVLLLSTPNALYTRPQKGTPENPFHIFEYTPDELRAEIERELRIEAVFGQSLNKSVRIPPFYREQRELPKDVRTQSMLLGWKVVNKMPVSLREWLSRRLWNAPFYPTEADYHFSPEAVLTAPVQLAVCRNK